MENTSFYIIFEVLKIEHKLEEGSTIQITEGLIAYENDHFTFYKWNITSVSVKEIKHKTIPVK